MKRPSMFSKIVIRAFWFVMFIAIFLAIFSFIRLIIL